MKIFMIIMYLITNTFLFRLIIKSIQNIENKLIKEIEKRVEELQKEVHENEEHRKATSGLAEALLDERVKMGNLCEAERINSNKIINEMIRIRDEFKKEYADKRNKNE